jgi:hypothetical protein
VPARPYKRRDKSKVEVGVQVVQRWILARLRRETFFSIEALNIRIRELLIELNARPMKKLGGISRRELFDRYERPALRPLPSERFEYAQWKRVNRQSRLPRGSRQALLLGSVPSGAPGDLGTLHGDDGGVLPLASRRTHRFASAKLRALQAHDRSGSHARIASAALCRRRAVISWAASVGPMTEAMVRRLIDANPVREQGWRSARGLQRVGEKCGPQRPELACARALKLGARSYKPVANILALGRENDPLPGEEPPEPTVIVHENVRGPGYYH